jgi:phage head maturation protease
MLRTKVYRALSRVLDEKKGRLSAIVSSESVDRDGDIIRTEGWDMKNFNSHPVLLANHDYHSLRSQIGVWEKMEIHGDMMVGQARFFIGKGNEEADWAFELAKEKQLAFSVGFIPDMEKAVPLHKGDAFGAQGMEYKGQELLEVSAVTVPSNPDALQRLVKSANLQPVIREIAEERLTAVDESEEQGMIGLKQEEDEEDEVPEEDEPTESTVELSEASVNAIVEGLAALLDAREAAASEEDDAEIDASKNAKDDEFDAYAEAVAAAEAALEEAQ